MYCLHNLGQFIAIIAGFFVPIVGIVLSCIGLSNLKEVPLAFQYNFSAKLKYQKAKKLCTVGIAIPVILWAIAIIMYFFIIVLVPEIYWYLFK